MKGAHYMTQSDVLRPVSFSAPLNAKTRDSEAPCYYKKEEGRRSSTDSFPTVKD